MTARRVVRSRRAKLPAGAVYVGRPTRWGNPFKVGAPHPAHGAPITRQEAVDLFRIHAGPMGDHELADEDIARLRGRDLACWCPAGQPCHADVLLEWANHA